MQSLAIKYRPHKWGDVVEQEDIKIILQNQLDTGDIRNAYLFVGGAGTGKTTCARILANEINKGHGSPIEIDGASNNGVDNIRAISDEARKRAIDSEYKIFIIDECHMITIQGWNAMLKLIEEPPLKTIFIFCTTNPEKIPKTILSRVQRYDFRRISPKGIRGRLIDVCIKESIKISNEAVEYIAKLACGHMRDALTMLDKVRLFTDNGIEEEDVISALGINNYYVLGNLFDMVMQCSEAGIFKVIEDCYNDGKDLKELIDDEIRFVLDYMKWYVTKTLDYCYCPSYVEEWFKNYKVREDKAQSYLNCLLRVKNAIKYEDNAKDVIESWLVLECEEL